MMRQLRPLSSRVAEVLPAPTTVTLEVLTAQNFVLMSQVSAVKTVRASARRYQAYRLARRSLDGLRRSLARTPAARSDGLNRNATAGFRPATITAMMMAVARREGCGAGGRGQRRMARPAASTVPSAVRPYPPLHCGVCRFKFSSTPPERGERCGPRFSIELRNLGCGREVEWQILKGQWACEP
jgi:hypothetical protein